MPLRDYPEIAKLHFLAGHPASALDYWNKHCRNLKPDSERDNWLARARAETEPYPNNIRYFYEIKEYKIAIEQWDAAGRIIDSDTPAKPLLDSAISLNDINAIRALLPLNNDLSQLSVALERIDRSDIHSLIGALPVAIAHSLQFRGNWKGLIEFASSQITPIHELNEIIKQTGIKWAKSELVASAVRVMAYSEQLAQNDSKVQKIVSNFLKQYLIIEKEAKRDKQKLANTVLKLVDIIEAGAAFERAYRLTYVLEFYEQFFVKNCLAHRILRPTNTQTEFAKRRWIFYKRRLAETQAGRGRDKHEREARELEYEWNISVDQEPKYPALQPISELDISKVRRPLITTGNTSDNEKEKPVTVLHKHMILAQTKLKLRDRELTAEVLTRKARITLTCLETQDQVLCGPNNVTSDDLEIACVKGLSDGGTWQIPAWEIQCEIESNDNGSVIRFRFADGEPILGFEFLSR